MVHGIRTSPVDVAARKRWDIRAGDTVKVFQKIKEKDKTRLQVFEGLVLARKHGATAGATFTVRRVLGGVGVERIFPLYSPLVEKIDVMRRAKVRRAKLYHVRRKAAKEIKRAMRNIRAIKEENSVKEIVMAGTTESHGAKTNDTVVSA